MSSYRDSAYDPVQNKVREAWWLDDYFGKHQYGVRFDENGPVYRPDDVKIPSNHPTPTGE